MIIFIDTETTGLLKSSSQLEQPHIVQFAAIVVSETGNEVARIKLLIRPDGWTVPAEAQAIHGISTEACDANGVPIQTILGLVEDLTSCCRIVVAHNLSFDSGVLGIEYLRRSKPSPLRALKTLCTMRAATPVLKLQGRYGYKWPTLDEAHRHFCGSAVERAHDALADVDACRRIYNALLAAGVVQPFAGNAP